MPDAGQIITILVVLISGGFAYLSQRSAAKASKSNTLTVTAVDREKEAYERARAFDTETITRQGKEIVDLRTKVAEAQADATAAREEAAAAQAEAHAAREEAAEAKRESQEARAENMVLREALADYVARDQPNNPYT